MEKELNLTKDVNVIKEKLIEDDFVHLSDSEDILNIASRAILVKEILTLIKKEIKVTKNETNYDNNNFNNNELQDSMKAVIEKQFQCALQCITKEKESMTKEIKKLEDSLHRLKKEEEKNKKEMFKLLNNITNLITIEGKKHEIVITKVSEPKSSLRWNNFLSTSHSLYFNDNRTIQIKKSSDFAHYSCAIGNQSVRRFTIKIEEHIWLRIGLFIVFPNDQSNFNTSLATPSSPSTALNYSASSSSTSSTTSTSCYPPSFKERPTNEEFLTFPIYCISNLDGDLVGVCEGKNGEWDKEKGKFTRGDYITIMIDDKGNIQVEKNKIYLGIIWTTVKVNGSACFPFVSDYIGSPSVSFVEDY